MNCFSLDSGTHNDICLQVVIALYRQVHYKGLCLEQNQFPLWPEQEDYGLGGASCFIASCVALRKTSATSYLYHLNDNGMINRICVMVS